LEDERQQRITIDVAYRFFATRERAFVVADAPGHEQYTRNMATGASTSELAVILVDARKGILPQTRRHAFICSLLGIRHIVLAINKMDLVAFDEHTFEEIDTRFSAFAAGLGNASICANTALRAIWRQRHQAVGSDAMVSRANPDRAPPYGRGFWRQQRAAVPLSGPMGQPSERGVPGLLRHDRLGHGRLRRGSASRGLGSIRSDQGDRHL
jgi:hypothetical protein